MRLFYIEKRAASTTIQFNSSLFTKNAPNAQVGYSERPIGHRSQLHLR